MTFDEYFQSAWPDHWATLKMYDENSPTVDHFDVMLPRRIHVAAERAWNDGHKAALLEAAEWFTPRHKYDEMSVWVVREELRRMAEKLK